MRVEDLIFDIGFHRGEDTAYYLAKGFRVVAFEANPSLIEHGKRRFAQEIADGRLRLVEGALKAEAAPSETVDFYVNDSNSAWGTVQPNWRERNATAFRAQSRPVRTPVVGIKDVITEVGAPFYVKIDIEGADREVLAAFLDFPDKPHFASIESEANDFQALEAELGLLRDLGYRRFQTVQQRTIPGSTIRTRTLRGDPLTYRFERDGSGAFGDDLAGEWLDFDRTLDLHRRLFGEYARWGSQSPLQKTLGRRPISALQLLLGRPLPGWYDTHARLD